MRNRKNKFVMCAVKLIGIYQKIVRPLLGYRCRFYPSCSDYSRQAILKCGFLKGSYKAIKRIASCHPFHTGGVDEV